ncbi:MAG: COG4280 domain-containing protein [Rhodopila sp.]
MDWTIFLPLFLAAAVEWVEAFTIVLAVSLTVGWAGAGAAAAAALVTLAALTAATGGVLSLGANIWILQLVVGVFLLLFGVRWLAKAVARQAGLKALHDEDREFAETRAAVRNADGFAAWIVAYKGVLLEGLEVWLIVVALSLHGSSWMWNTIAALSALLVICIAGAAVRAPLRRVPENALKFIVGVMIVSFGTYWTLESLAGDVWPLGDASLLALAAFYLIGGLLLVPVLRARRLRRAMA